MHGLRRLSRILSRARRIGAICDGLRNAYNIGMPPLTLPPRGRVRGKFSITDGG
jgi:hypothetical protein